MANKVLNSLLRLLRPRSPVRRATLGYHVPGAFHYFSQFTEDMTWLGSRSDQSFTTHSSFAALVTAIHEYHHFLQELLQGFSWWRSAVQDDLSVAVSEVAVRSAATSVIRFPLTSERAVDLQVPGGDALGAAKRLATELEMIDAWSVSPEMTRLQLDLEVAKYPDFRRVLNDDLYSLTTLDLVECHAALLTELCVSRHMAESPGRFDTSVARDCESLFRLGRMPGNYGKAFRVVAHIFEESGLAKLLTFPGPVHPMYQNVHQGGIYLTTAFLLDYALHVPPGAMSLFAAHLEPTTVFDLHPPLRFISLALLLAVEVVTNRHGFRGCLTSEARLYAEGDSSLAYLVNETRATERRSVAKYAKADTVPNTFFSLKDSTGKWRSYWKDSGIRGRFKEVDALRERSVGFRATHPDCWFHLDPQGIGSDLEIPHVAATSEGVHVLPFLKDHEKRSPEQLRQYLQDAIAKSVKAQLAGHWDSSDVEELPLTLFPRRFMAQSMEYEMFQSFGRMVLDRGCMHCPLTTGLGRAVPCAPRSSACENIRETRALPKSGCRLRAVVEKNFGDPDRFANEVR